MDKEMIKAFLGGLIFDTPSETLVSSLFEVIPSDIFDGEDRLIWETLRELQKEGKIFTRNSIKKKIREIISSSPIYFGYKEIEVMKYVNSLPKDISGGQAIFYLLPDLIEEVKKDVLLKNLKELQNGASVKPDEILSDINNIFIDLNHAINLEKKSFDVESGIDRFITMYKRGKEGIKSYIKELDDALESFPLSEISIIAGRPGTGKTTLATYIFYKAILNNIKSCYLSLEMPVEKIIEKMVSIYRFENGEDINELKASLKLKEIMKEGYIYDDDITPFSNLLRKIITHAEEGYKLFIIDHIQLVNTDIGLSSTNRVQELSYISSTLKSLANKYNISLLVLSQLSRLIERRGDEIPKSSDLRDSGALEQDAANVIFLIPRDYEMDIERSRGNTRDIPIPPYREVKLYITKARYGTDRRVIFKVIFIPQMNVFTNVFNFEEVECLPTCSKCGDGPLDFIGDGFICKNCNAKHIYKDEWEVEELDGYTFASVKPDSVAIKASAFITSSLLNERGVMLPCR